MASIVVSGNTSGTITISAPDVSGTNTLTLPANTGTVLTSASTITPSAGTVTQASLSTNVAGNGPAFRAYQDAGQTISNTTFTKVTLATEDYDTASCFASSRFTPTVAGYYLCTGNIRFSASTAGPVIVAAIYKNGAAYQNFEGSTNSSDSSTQVTSLVYLNGSTDYVELYTYQNYGGNRSTTSGASQTSFQGFLARSA
jgi:hypothetical protein